MANKKEKCETITESEEIARLSDIYKELPPKKRKVAHGLIVQAARLRVRLDYLWKDLCEHGEVELFSQSENTEPYERERPSSRIFTATDKSYQSIIKQLNDMVPEEQEELEDDFDCN